jgi:hypothetical protein
VKSFRRILRFVAFAFAIAAILAALAFAPLVQTWIAQAFLASHPAMQGSIGSLSVGFGSVEIEDLHIEPGGAVLKLPSLQARLPLTTAAWSRKVSIRSIVAKDWTLDLSRVRESEPPRAMNASAPEKAPEPNAEVIPARRLARVFLGLLNDWKLPCDASLDGVDLEGDLLVADPPKKAPVRIHVIVKGGGLTAGRDGVFAIDATNAVVNSDLSVTVFAAHGRLVVATTSERTVSRIEIKADLSAKGGPFPEDLALSADFAAAYGPGGENYTLELSRGSRHIATVLARLPPANGRFAGTWKVDLRDSDLAPFFPDRALPTVTTIGEGRFDADTAFARVHASGRLNSVASHLGILATPLERAGSIALDVHFDLIHSGQSLRVDQWSASIAASGSDALVQSLQPFVLDEKTGNLRMTAPKNDWLEGSIRGFPMAWLSGPNDGLAFAGGTATGEIAVRFVNGEFSVRSKAPLTATGVSLQRGGRIAAHGLELSLSMTADCASDGWLVEGAPLTIGSAGRRWATIQAKAARTGGADQSVAITGTWNADLDALATQSAIPGMPRIPGRLASGDFNANLGPPMSVETKLTLYGHDPAKSATGSMHADFNADGSIGFLAPFKIAFGSSASELSAEGAWSRDPSGARIDAKLTGPSAAIEHLRLLAGALAAAAGAPVSAGRPDRIPFWGELAGTVTVGFDRLRAGDKDFVDVGGTFDIGPGFLRLKYGHGAVPHHSPANAEGSISFDSASGNPYSLRATATVQDVEAAPYFGKPQHGEDPIVEGRFSVATMIAGSGTSLEDLSARTHEEFHLTSAGGIVRLLKANVAESLPEVTTPVADTLGKVGSIMGSLVGIKRDSSRDGEIRLSKTTEAVLDFTNQVSEIGYDQIAVDAVREPDGSIHIVDLAMTAPYERLNGSGQIGSVKNLPLSSRPLSLDLQFGARGRVAELLANAGLLSPKNDGLGYAPLKQTIHFGGTLEHIDGSPWRDLLVTAATPKPDRGRAPAPDHQ